MTINPNCKNKLKKLKKKTVNYTNKKIKKLEAT